MLHKTIQTAIPYAQELEQARIALGLPNSSHLAMMVSNSLFSNPDAEVPVSQFVQTVENVTIVEGGVTEHERVSEQLVNELAPLVQNHVSLSRQIGSLSKDFAETVQKYVNATPSEDPTGNFNIVKDELGDLFDESSVLSDLENASTPKSFIGSMIASGPRDFETLLGYVTTGRAKIDQAIQSTVAQHDKNFLENIWYGLFNSGMGQNSPYALNNLGLIPSGERLAVTYLGYLMAQRLYSEVSDDAVGALNVYQRNCADLRDHLLSLAAVALRERHNQIKNKVVVLSFNPATRTVVVNGPIYREWLEQGGSPDTVLGCLLSDASSYTADQLNNKQTTYNNQWTSYCAFHNAEYDVRRVRFLRSIYMIALTESMTDIQPYEEAYRKENPGFAEFVLSEAQKMLDRSSLDSLCDIEMTTLNLIAGIRFSYTPAKMILESIDRTMKSTPNVDVREAALVAACGYIAQYLLTQITVSKI